MNLYEIVNQYQDQLAALNDTDLPPEVVLDTIEGMQGEVEDKVRAVVAYALQIKADAETRKEHAKRMSESARTMEKRSESLMMYAQINLMNSGLKLPLALPEFTLNLAKLPPSLQDDLDMGKLPTEYLKRNVTFRLREDQATDEVLLVLKHMGVEAEVETAVDRQKLLSAVKANPDACKGFARLNPQGYRLSIR